MNPFTESTVARPLTHDPFGPCDQPACPGRGATNEHAASTGVTASGVRPTKTKQRPGATSSSRRKPGHLATIMLAAAGLMAGLLLPHNAQAIDVNQAGVEQLKGVRGIGPKTAQIIIDERARGGSYESFGDLSDRVKGIGPKKAAALQQAGLTIGASAETRVDAPAPSAKPPKKPGR